MDVPISKERARLACCILIIHIITHCNGVIKFVCQFDPRLAVSQIIARIKFLYFSVFILLLNYMCDLLSICSDICIIWLERYLSIFCFTQNLNTCNLIYGFQISVYY